MYTGHLEAAWNAEIKPRPKILLLAFAHHACQHCGLAWPGIPRLAERCSMGVNAVRETLADLVKGGHLELFSHSKGGRGCTTIYRVLPGRVATVDAPCEQCWANLRLTPSRRTAVHPVAQEAMAYALAPAAADGAARADAKPSPRGAGKADEARAETLTPGARVSAKPSPRGEPFDGTGNPPPGARVSAIPSGFHRKTLPPGVRRTVREDEQSTRAGAREAVATPPGLEPPDPTTPGLSVGDGLRAIGLRPGPSLDAIPMAPASAATAADKGKAQPSGHARLRAVASGGS